jgi:hypothetical protein
LAILPGSLTKASFSADLEHWIELKWNIYGRKDPLEGAIEFRVLLGVRADPHKFFPGSVSGLAQRAAFPLLSSRKASPLWLSHHRRCPIHVQKAGNPYSAMKNSEKYDYPLD